MTPALVWLLRLLAFTWRVERDPWPVPGASVVAFWHGEVLPMLALHRDSRLTGGAELVALASLSKDGDIVTAALERLGYGVIRGSSSRGGFAALRAAKAAIKAGRSPALAVDGPRGPAGVVQPGAEALAKVTGAPVVWGRVEAAGWRARSWDRMLVPWPFARVRIRYGVWTEGRLRESLGPPDGWTPGQI